MTMTQVQLTLSACMRCRPTTPWREPPMYIATGSPASDMSSEGRLRRVARAAVGASMRHMLFGSRLRSAIFELALAKLEDGASSSVLEDLAMPQGKDFQKPSGAQVLHHV